MTEAVIRSTIRDMLEANTQDGAFDISTLFKVYTDFLKQKEPLHRKLFTSDSYRGIFDSVQDKACRYFLERYQHTDSRKAAACISFLAYGTNAVWRLNYAKEDPTPQEIMGSWASEWVELLLNSI